MKKIGMIITFLIVLVGIGYNYREKILRYFFAPTPSPIKQGVMVNKEESAKEDIEVIAENLQIPWEIAFLPTGEMLVTQRPGKLLLVDRTTNLIAEIEGVEHVGEGGLQGMAIHPKYNESNFIFLYLTSKDSGKLINRVERYRLLDGKLQDKTVIMDAISGASFHDGGRVEFGPDGYLYIATGDAGKTQLSQDKSSLNGKILRVDAEGNPPSDNPFGNEIYSIGHRNVQGLAWDDKGKLWSTEHGPSGLQSGFDEVNLIRSGENYGWPDIKGDETTLGMQNPEIHSGADDTWAPAGAAYWDGSLFFGGLRGEALYEFSSLEGIPEIKAHFKGEFGRIRAVVLGPDEYIYISTSNTDGRGQSRSGDDKIIRINPAIFRK